MWFLWFLAVWHRSEQRMRTGWSVVWIPWVRGKRSGFEVWLTPVLYGGPGDPEVNAGQNSEPHSAGDDCLTNLTSASKFPSAFILLDVSFTNKFSRCLRSFTWHCLTSGTSLGWNCCLTCRFRLSQHLSSHVDLFVSSFAWCKIDNSAPHLDFSSNWMNPGLLRPLRLCVWLLKGWFGQVLL